MYGHSRHLSVGRPWLGAILLLTGILRCSWAGGAEEPAENEVWLFGSEHCADCTAFKQWWGDHPDNVKGLKLVNLSIDDMAVFKQF